MAVIAAVVTAVLATHYSGNMAAGPLDRWAQTTVQRLLPQRGPAALLINIIGEPMVMTVLVGLLGVTCLILRRRRLAVVAVTGPSLTGIATTVLKPVIGRTIHGAYLAYPSGHTAAATGLALIIMLLAVDLLRAGRLLGVLLILSGTAAAGATMAWAQVTLTMHYPTDTIGGFCTAMAILPATALLVDAFAGRRRDMADTLGR
jgi:undecaprenyl-diphosphatase